MSATNEHTAQASLLRAELTEQAVSLVRDGKSYRQVAEALQISVGTAHNYVKAALAALPTEAAAEMRTAEGLRLELLWEKTLARLDAEDCDLEKTVETLRKLSESKRKLFGLDAPQQIQGEFTVAYTVNGVNPEALR